MAFVAEREGDVVQLPWLSRELSPVRDLVAAVRLARLIRRVRPDVLHTHTAKAGAVGRDRRDSPERAGRGSSCTPSTGTCCGATSAVRAR